MEICFFLLLFIVQKSFFPLHNSVLAMPCKYFEFMSNMGKTLSNFFHIKPVRFQDISKALLGPLPVFWKGPLQLRGSEA
jgi:hypothetical protein